MPMSVTRRAFCTGLVLAIGFPRMAFAQIPAAPGDDVFQADFDELYARLTRAHFDLFAHRSRAEYDALHAGLRQQLVRRLARTEAIAIFQRFVAFGRVAHARIDAAGDAFRAHRAAGGRAFPLTLRVKQGRVFVMSNASGSADPAPGDEVLEIESMPAPPLIDSLWQDVSADTPYMFHSMVEWDLPRLLWQRFGTRGEFDLVVRRPGDTPRTVRVPARSRAEMGAAPSQPAALNLSLTDRTYRVVDSGLGYFRPGPFYAAENPEAMYDNRAFVRLVDEAFGRFTAASVPRLIIDLRDNPGGDNSFSDHVVAWFARCPFRFASAFRIRVTPETIASHRARLAIAGNDPTGAGAMLARAYANARMDEVIDFPIPTARPRTGSRYEGEVFVLINRHSYSNTVSAASLIQDYGFGTIIGEETSDLATTYGAMESFALSRSGIVVGYPKARIVRPSGSLESRGVVPDIAIDTPVVETEDDIVLQRAMAVVRSSMPRRPELVPCVRDSAGRRG